MTSLHRLIAIVIIWLVVAFMGAVMQGLALSLTANTIALLVVAILAVAGAATWGIARAQALVNSPEPDRSPALADEAASQKNAVDLQR